MRKLIFMTLFMVAFSATAFAAEPEQDILIGESIKVDSDYKIVSADESVAKAEDGVINGVAPGETTVTLKKKKFFRTVSEKTLKVNVYEGSVLRLSPRTELNFEPKMTVYNETDTPIMTFGIDEEIRLLPGNYYVREETEYSHLHDSPLMVDLSDGQKRSFSIYFNKSSKVTFKAEKALSGEKISLYRKKDDSYVKVTTLTIGESGKTDTLKILPGNYWWGEESEKIKAPECKSVEFNGKEIYPFTVPQNPVTITLSAVSAPVSAESVSLEKLSENAEKIYSDLTQLYRLNPISACAIIGNMYGESGIRTGALEHGGGGHGLCQWTGGRWTNLQNFAASQGREWTDIEVQIDFLMKELAEMNMDEFWSAPTVEEATEIFMRRFERPAEWVYPTSLPRRIGAAQDAMKRFQ